MMIVRDTTLTKKERKINNINRDHSHFLGKACLSSPLQKNQCEPNFPSRSTSFYRMLNRPGDLIPVTAEAAKLMTWSNRSSKIVEYLHRGPVSFSTLVYDTNVGDIATIASYFNPEMVSLEELNNKYAQRLSKTGGGEEQKEVEEVQVPRLLVYPALSNQSSLPTQTETPWLPYSSHLRAFESKFEQDSGMGKTEKQGGGNDNLHTVMANIWNQVDSGPRLDTTDNADLFADESTAQVFFHIQI